MSFGTSSGGMVPTAGFPLPAITSGSFTIAAAGIYEAHLVGGGAGGLNYGSGSFGGGGATTVFARRYYAAGHVINYIVGAGGTAEYTTSGASAIRFGGTTVFGDFAAQGALGQAAARVTDLPSQIFLTSGYDGGQASSNGSNPPRLVTNVDTPGATNSSPGGGASAYGKAGVNFNENATGYGAGGARGNGVNPGGNGSQGCIYLFGPL